MFEKLDDVDWASLEHAYGKAEDVPQMIRGLASHDEDARDEAFYTAYGNIFHQGTRYEATAPAVPFLLEILEQPDYPAHGELLFYLSHLVMGFGEAYIPFGFSEEISAMREALVELRARPDSERQAEDGEEWGTDEDWLTWITAITDEARKGIPRYIRFLGADDERVRIAACFLLSWLPEDYEMFAPALWQLVEEDESDAVRANALIALALASDDDGFAEFTAEVTGMLEDSEPIVQFAAAIALGTRKSDDAPDSVVQILLDAVARAGSEEADDEEAGEDWMIAWYDGESGAYASEVLSVVSADNPDRVVSAVGDALTGMHTMQAANASTTMVAMLFPEGFEGDTASELDELQRSFLRVLAEVRNPWFLDDASFANFSLMMGDFGLPDSMEKLREFLG